MPIPKRKNAAFLSLYLLIGCTAFSQQESTIKIDSGNKNDITVVQAGDTAARSNVTLKKSDSNKINVNQAAQMTATATPPEKSSHFNEWVTNTNNLFILLISFATFIGLLWKGIPYIKKMATKK